MKIKTEKIDNKKNRNDHVSVQAGYKCTKISILARKKRHNTQQNWKKCVTESLERVVTRKYLRPHFYNPRFLESQGLPTCP